MSASPTLTDVVQLLRELADRLRHLEEVQAAALQRLGKPAPTAVNPLRVSRNQAATILGVSIRRICTYASTGLLVRLPKPRGAGKTVRTFFHADNVAALAQSEDAAREWVARRKFVTLSSRSPR